MKTQLIACAIASTFLAFSAQAEEQRFMVKMNPNKSALSQSVESMSLESRVSTMSRKVNDIGFRTGLKVDYQRPMSNGYEVININTDGMTASEVKALLEQSGEVSEVFVDTRVYASPDDSGSRTSGFSTTTPMTSDPYFTNQPYFESNDVFPGAVNVTNAQSVKENKRNITVAVLDTGYVSHQDITWLNGGYDFVNDDNDPEDVGVNSETSETCTSGHGLGVASIIAAKIDNGLNIAGMTNGVDVLPIKVIDSGCGAGGYLSDVIDSLNWLAGETITGVPAYTGPKVSVANLSLGSEQSSCPSLLKDAIDRLLDKNVAVVVSAGNDGKSSSQKSPANCPNVINVGSVDLDTSDISGFSNYGSDVDLGAMGNGVAVLSHNNEDGLGIASGTSQAAPLVAGAIAMGLESIENDIHGLTLEKIIKKAVNPYLNGATLCSSSSTVNDECFNSGVLDTEKAVNMIVGYDSLVQETQLEAKFTEGDSCEDGIYFDEASKIVPVCETATLKMSKAPSEYGFNQVVLYTTQDDGQPLAEGNLNELGTSANSDEIIFPGFDETKEYGYKVCFSEGDCSEVIKLNNDSVVMPSSCP